MKRSTIMETIVVAMLSAVSVSSQTSILNGSLQAPPATADTNNPTFEVASVKPNKSEDGRSFVAFQPGGRFNASNVPLLLLIAMAYGTPQPIPPFRILGGPDWLASDRFDFTAKAEGDLQPGPNGPAPQMLLMLRTLLAQRFKLVVHTETRDLPIYTLVLARSDGKLGAQLRASTVDCVAMRAALRGQALGPPPPPPPPPQPGERPPCGMFNPPGRVASGSATMAQLSNVLSGRVARPVVDKTGLAGFFDIDLNSLRINCRKNRRRPVRLLSHRSIPMARRSSRPCRNSLD